MTIQEKKIERATFGSKPLSQSPRLSYRLLEPRMVFDAALAATLADGAAAKAPIADDGSHATAGHDVAHDAMVDALHQTSAAPSAMDVSVLSVPVDAASTATDTVIVCRRTTPAIADVTVSADAALVPKDLSSGAVINPARPVTSDSLSTASNPDTSLIPKATATGLVVDPAHPAVTATADLVADTSAAAAGRSALLMPDAIPSTAQSENIVFVDPAVENAQAIVAHVAAGSQVVYLDAASDGLDQIAAYLSTHHDVASIHILSHGATGELLLGNTVLTDANLDAHRAALDTISHALRPGGDILIYGCNVASGDAGGRFIQHIAALTGDDVAASIDSTGDASQGGNWVLEAKTGVIVTATISALDYNHLLALGAVDDTNSVSANATTAITGNVLTNDTGTNPKTVTEVHGRAASVGVAYQTSYGTITMNANGTYNYQVDVNNSSVHGLIAGQSLVDIISYTGRDNASATPDYGVLSITINGINDPPIAYDNVNTVTPTSAPSATGNLITDTAVGNPADYIDRPAQTFNWVSQYGNNTSAFGTTRTVGTGVNAVTVSVTHSDPSSVAFISGGVNQDGLVSTATQGGQPGYVQLYISPDGHTTGNATTGFTYTTPVTTLGFSQPVSNLEFSLLDVDTSRTLVQFQANNPSTWIDQVTINATRNGQPVTFHAQYSGYDTRTGNSFAGNNINVLPADANGNIHVVFDGPVDSVAIGFNDGAAATGYQTGTFGSHLVGISNLSWQSQGGERVTQITTNGSVNTTVASGGSVTVAATYGIITVASNGSYTYNVDPANAAVRALAPDATLIDNVPYMVIDTNGLTASAVLHVTVNGINDAPAGTDHTSTINEDTPYTFAASDFGFTDPIDNPSNTFQSVVITTLPPAADGTLTLGGVAVTAGQELTVAQIASLVFTPTLNSNGNSRGAFTFQVRDNGGTANGGIDLDQSPNTFKFNITPVNDPPVLDLNATTAGSGHVTTFTENGTPVDIANTDISVTDVDNTTMQSATVVLTNRQAGDVLAIGTLPAGIQYAIDASNPAQITISLTGNATLASYQSVIQGITYSNSTDSPSAIDRTVTVVVNDGALNSNVATTTIHVVPVNDAPVIAQAYTVYTTTLGVSDNTFSNGTITNGGLTTQTSVHPASVDIPVGTTLSTITTVINLAYFDNSGTVIINGTNISPLTYLQVEATSPQSGNETVVTFADGSVAQTTYLANTNGLPRFQFIITDHGVQLYGTRSTSSTVLELMQLPTGVNFKIPTFTTGTNSIQVVNLDGPGPDASAGTIQVFGNLTTPPQTTPEDTPIIFSSANGNAINFSDVDAGASGVEIVTLAVTHGTLNLASTTGLTGLTGNGTGSVSFSGTVAQINAAVAGLKYTNTPDYNGTDSLTITLKDDGKDNGTSTSNGVLTATPKVIPITITPVVDITPDTLTTAEDTAISFNVLTGTNGATADSFEGTPSVTAVSSPSHGTVIFAANGQMTYTPAANYNGTDSYTYTVTSGGVTETTTVTINITAVNDAPLSAVPTAQTVNEDGSLVFSGATAITISDVDAGAAGLETVTLSVANGKLTLGSTTGITGLTGNGTGSVTFTGTVSQVNAAVAGLTYLGNPNFNGSDTLSISVVDDGKDNGTLASNGAQTSLLKTVPITVLSVNDAPAGTDKTTPIVEGTTYTFSVSDFGFTDPNDSPVNTFKSVMITTLPPATDGILRVGGVPVVLGQELTAAQVATLTFTPTLNKNGNGLGAFTFQVRDNGGTANGGVDLDQSPNTFQFNITPFNDPPVSSVPAAQTVLEDTALTFSSGNSNAITISDVDAGSSGLETVSLSVGKGKLTLGSTTGLTGVTGNGTGIVSFTGTVAQVNAAMNGLVYLGNANANGPDTLTVNVTDDGKDNGTAAANGTQSAAVKTIAINVTPVNDAPAGTDHTSTTLEDTPYTFAAADFGFTDPNDTPANTLQSVIITTLPPATDGVLRLGGVAVTAGQELTAAQIASLVFTPAANRNGTGIGAFTFQVRDTGGTANGGVDLDQSPNTFNFNVTSVNDAPAGTDKTIAATEDTVFTFAAADFGFTDPNDTPANTLQSVIITTLPPATDGILRVGGVAVTAGQELTAAQLATLTFTPAANVNGANLGAFTFQVRDNGGTANGGIDLDQSPNTIKFSVAAVNDAPAGTDHTSTTLEDTPYTFAAADFGFTDPNDTPANTLQSVIITTLPPATDGVLRLSGVAVTAGQELTAAQIASLVFTPAANRNGTGIGAFTFQVRDTGGTANGGVDLDQSPNTFNFNVTSVNDAPAGTDKTIAATEDTVFTFAAADFGFTDPNDTPANTLQSVIITTLPPATDGILRVGGVAVTAGQELTAAQLATLTFTPAANVNGANLGAFTFQVRDNGGTANGGIDLDQSPNTIKFSVAAVNDAPVANPDSGTTLEDTPVTITAATLLANDTDVDTGDTRTLVSVQGAVNGTVTLNASGDPVFTPNANFNGTASYTYTIRDTGGLTSTATVTITVTPVNDAPAGADHTSTINEDTPYTFAAADFGFTDPNDTPANTLQSVIITTLPPASEGILRVGGVAVTAGQELTAAQLASLTFTPAANINGANFGAFTFQVRDNGGTANGGVDLDQSPNTFNFNVTPVNDAPVAVNDIASTLEDTPITITAATLLANDTDVDTGDTKTLVSVQSPVNGTVTLNPSGDPVFTPNANFNGTASYTYTIRDSGGLTSTATVTITVTPVNDAPSSTVPATQTVLEDTPLVFSGANAITVFDVDAAVTGQETVTLTVGHGTVTLGSTSGITGLSGDGTPMVSFTGTLTQVNAAIAGLKYQADANYNGTDTLSVAILDDGKDNGTLAANGALSSVIKTVTINVTPVNDAPAGADHTSTLVEDTPYTFSANDFGFTDPNDTPANALQLVIITTLPPATDGVLTVNGVAVTAGQELTAAQIGQLVFTPAANRNGTGIGAFAFQVRDNGGTANGGVDLDQSPNAFTFNVTPSNDAPVSMVPPAQTVNEDTQLVFSGANAVTISDVDAGSSGLETVTLSVAHGTLNLGSFPVGLTYTNDGTATVTLTGTLSQVNAAISGLKYQGVANYNGADLLTIQVKDDGTDNGVAASNGTLSGVIHTVAITVISVNDAPAGTDKTVGIQEDTPYTFTTADFGFTDPNDSPANTLQSVIITTLPPATDGILRVGGVAVTAGQELTAAQIATLTFTPAANVNGANLGAFTFQVRDNGGTANGGVNLDQSPNAFKFNVAAVNDPPVAVNDSYATGEHSTLNVPVGTGLLANDTDVDNAHTALVVTQVNGNTISSGAPITLPSGAILTQNADGSFAYNPNNVYNSLTTGQSATDTFTYQVSDGSGGFATATATVRIDGINDPPVAVADNAQTSPIVVLTADAAHGVLANDTDVDTAYNLLSVSAVNGVAGNVNTAVAGSNGGLFNIHADGSYTFDPNGQFAGVVAMTSITYTVTDGTNTSTTTLTVSVPYTNLPPYVAQPVTPQSSLDGEAIAIDLSNTFSDPNPGDQGHLTLAASGLPPGLSLVSATNPSTGVVTYSITGTLLSNDSVHAGPYLVTLTATDSAGSTSSTTFNFSVGNPAPVAANDTNTTTEHGTTTGNVLTNDHDGGNDHDMLSVSLVNGQAYTAGSTITLASGAQLVMGADGSYTYDTHSAFNGLAVGATATDSFIYQVSDGQGGYATATATITITGQNDTPYIVDPANPGTPPSDPNHVVPSQAAQDGTAISPLNVSNYFKDPDTGDTLTLSTTGTLPAGITFNPATGTFSGTPSATASQGGPGNNGVYSVLVTADDGHGGLVSTTVTFTITNPAPVAGNDSNTVLEHASTTGNVLTNDHDGGGDTDPLTVATVNGQTVASGSTITLPSGALLVMNANGTYSYDPHGSFAALTAAQSATDTFTYTITDGQGGTSQATVTIQIQGQNDNPVARSDTNVTNPQVPVSADAAHGVLANDSDVEHDPLAVTSITNGTSTVSAGGTIAGTGGGTFTINADGSYTFNPGTDFNNLAVGASAQSSVTYTISDGHGGASSTTLTVTVPYDNLAPVVQAPIPTQNTLDGNTVSIPLGGVFSDPNTIDTLTITATGLPSGLVYNPATGAIEGTLASDASQHGGVPYTVTLTANDGHGGTTTSTFVMNVANPAPVAANDANTVTEHGTITGAASVLGNDHDGLNDHDPLTVSQVNGQAYTPGSSIMLASGAQLVMNADGTYSYDPNSAFNGLAVGQTATDTFTYQVSDGQGGVATATVTITVTGQNEAPVVIDPAHPGTPPIDPNHIVPTQTGQDGSAVTPLVVRGFFKDADTADTLTYTVNPTFLPAGLTFANGVFSGTPSATASQNGNVSPGVYDIAVTASDGHGGTVSTTVRYTITNPAPVAASDSNSVAEHGTITGAASVLGNDHDGGSDTDPLAVTQVNGTAITSGATIVLPSGALLVMKTDGTYSYNPNGAFIALQAGQATTEMFTYQVSDGQGGFATARVTIVVNGENDAPVAANDANSVSGASASISVTAPLGVLANDTDPEHGVLTVSTVNVGATSVPAGTSITGSNGGHFIVNAEGSYSFDPGTDFLNLAPGQVAQSSVTYTVTDDHGATATATLTITVPYENLPPVLNQMIPAQSSFDGNPVSIDVTNVFRDPNGDALSISATGLPPGLTYNPMTHVISGDLASSASNHAGPWVVTLTADDGHGGSLTTTFNFTVNNQPPVAGNDTNTVSEHGTLTGQTVMGNDHDGGLDQDTLAVAQVNGASYTPGMPITLASGAVITMLADGTYSYDTHNAFNGLALGETASDSFTYTITDSQGATATATVAITITGQNDAPVIVDPAHPGQPVTPGTQVVPAAQGLDGSAISPLSVATYFADPDHGDTVTLSVDPSTLPAGITFNPATGTFSGTLGPNDSIGGPSGNGTYPVTVTGTDANGATVSTTVVFRVGNPAPIAGADSNTVAEHATTTGNVLANDHDGGSDTDQLHVSQINGSPLVPGTTITLPSGAQLVMAADGTYSYDPHSAFNGLGQGETATDSFTYQVSDGQGGFATATATITIAGQNDAPIVVDPAHPGVPVPPGTAVVPQQSANDGSPITPVNVTSVFADPDTTDHLTLSVNPATLPPGIVFDPISGTFTGTPAHDASAVGPDPAYPGTYPVTVTATDSHGATVTTVVTFVIANPPPVAAPDTASVPEHGTVTANVLTNDHDGGSDTDPLHVSQINGVTFTPGTPITLPSGAQLTMAADGTYTYDPNGVFNGLAQDETATQTFTYQVSDNNGGFSTATVTLTITGVNDAPTVVDAAHPGTPPADSLHIVPGQTGQDGSAITLLDVTGYFTDSDHGDTLTLSVPAGSLPPGVTFVNGVFSGTPTSDASHGGPANNGTYPITVTATDSFGATVTTIVTFTVTNPAPVATNDTLATPADTTGTGMVLYNDHDGGSDYDTLTVSQVNGAAYTPGAPITLPSGAILTMNAGGTYSYNPNGIGNTLANHATLSDSFTYQVSDGQGGFDTATVNITVQAVNAAPVVIDPAHPGTPPADPLHVVPAQTGLDGSAIAQLSVASYFTDPNSGDVLTYSVPVGSLPPGVSFDPGTGTFSGTPAAAASTGGPSNNGMYPIVVTASDGYGGTVSTIVTFQIGNVAPVAADDTLSVPVHGGPVLGGAVLTNDHDGGGDTDPLHVSQVNGAAFTPGAAITLPSGALLTMNTDGTYTYNPNGTHPGLGYGQTATDSFSYQVSDGQGGFANATVDITLTGVNDPPVVVDPAHPGTRPADPSHVVPTLGGSDGAPITPLNVSTYFTDPNTGDTLTLSVNPATLPPGVMFDPATGTFTGTPTSDASIGGPAGNGTYPVVVTADDGHGGTVTTIVVFQIGNQPPVAVADTGSVLEHGTTTGSVLTNDHDGGGDTDPLHVSQVNGTPLVPGALITLPSGAQLVMATDGSYTYNPNGAFSTLALGETASDQFTYQVSDGQGGFATATATITISGQNDAPVVVDPAHPGQPPADPMHVIPAQTASDGSPITPLTVTAFFHDPDGSDHLTLSVPTGSLPPGIVFDPATGTFTGTPTADASTGGPSGNGTYPVVITASDGHGGTVSTVIVFAIANAPPVAVDDTATASEHTGTTGSVLSNDHDGGADTDPLHVTQVNGQTLVPGSTITLPSGALLVMDALGNYTYNPNGVFQYLSVGETGADTFTYQVSDGQGGFATATVTISVTGVNDAPFVIDPATGQPSTHPDTVIPVVGGSDGATITPLNVAAVFHDPDAHDTLTLTVNPATLPPGITFDPATGTFTGTPSSNASQGGPNGDGVYPIIVTASDGHGGTVTTTVTFTFTNLPPVASNDFASGQPDQVLTLNVLGNDHDGGNDHDQLTVVSATSNTGTTTINPNGTLNFKPASGFAGFATITYTISDGQGGLSTATATVLITPNIPVIGPPAPALPGSTDLLPGNTGITATGAVLDAVHAADDLGTNITSGLPTGVTASGIVDLAANQISHLGGLASRGALIGSADQFGPTDPRLTSPVWQLQHLISERFGAPSDTWNPEGLTGFSLRYTFAADQTSNARAQIVLDSLVRDRTLIVNLSSTRIDGHAHVVEYRVMQADGRPLPSWLDRAGTNVLMGERPVDAEEIELHVIAVMSDGTTIERDVVIQTNSGEIQPLKETKRTDVIPLFSDQLRQFAKRDETEFERLLTALAG